MAGILNLEKNGILDLTKTDSTLENLKMACGWDVASKGFFSFAEDYDLDLCAVLKGEGKQKFVFYNNKTEKGVRLDKDNRTGEGDGDDENIFLNLKEVPSDVNEIEFHIIIYQAESRKQSFQKVKNAYGRLVDMKTDKELVRFELTENGGDNYAVHLVSLRKDQANHWNFVAIGEYGKYTTARYA